MFDRFTSRALQVLFYARSQVSQLGSSELEPEHILCGHGAGVHGPAATVALREALETSRRRLPRALASSLRRRKS